MGGSGTGRKRRRGKELRERDEGGREGEREASSKLHVICSAGLLPAFEWASK